MGQLTLWCRTFTLGELRSLSILSHLLNEILHWLKSVLSLDLFGVLHLIALLFTQLLLLH